MLLSSRLGMLGYLLMPNHWGWACLSADERASITRGNITHNTERADYVDPLRYQAGMSRDRHRAQLRGWLHQVRPTSVLEVGIGSGELTRDIVTYPTVRRYVAVDVNRAFLDYVQEHVRAVRPSLSTAFIEGTIDDAPVDRVDAAVLIETVHHIPDRVALFRSLAARVRCGGSVLAIDPTHYVQRISKILRKARTPGHLADVVASVRRGTFGTHNMCSLGEYRALATTTGFRLTAVYFSEHPRRLQRWRACGVPLGPLWRWCANEIVVEAQRGENTRQTSETWHTVRHPS